MLRNTTLRCLGLITILALCGPTTGRAAGSPKLQNASRTTAAARVAVQAESGNSKAQQVPGRFTGSAGPILKVPQARLVVDSVAIHPVEGGGIPEGVGVNLSIQVENRGPVTSGDQGSYTVTCMIVQGARCPVPDHTGSIAAIEPGFSKSVVLFGATPAVPGTYRLYVSVSPSARMGRPFSTQFVVKSNTTLMGLPEGGLTPGIGRVPMSYRRNGTGNGTTTPTPVVAEVDLGSLGESMLPDELPSSEAPDVGVEACSALEYGNLCCKIVQPGGDLNAFIHVKNATGTDLPAGQYVLALTVSGPVDWKLSHPLAKGQWTAGPTILYSEAYSEQFEKAYCYAATEVE